MYLLHVHYIQVLCGVERYDAAIVAASADHIQHFKEEIFSFKKVYNSNLFDLDNIHITTFRKCL